MYTCHSLWRYRKGAFFVRFTVVEPLSKEQHHHGTAQDSCVSRSRLNRWRGEGTGG